VDFNWNENRDPKGIGELPFTLIPGAFAQAVSQAIGSPIRSLPITPYTIEEALLKREKQP
jgi:CO/xanthine dehydrogenase Mo-binding subunit